MAHSWYLGIDFSASGLAATLYDRQQNQSYPLYWMRSSENIPESPIFSLSLDSQGILSSSIAIAPSPIYFHGAIPCYNRQSRQWEPQFHNGRTDVVSLYQLQQSLQNLLDTLNPDFQTVYRVGTEELSTNALNVALLALEGIIVNCSVVHGDTYRFNLREAILGAKLVEIPDRIFFLEEAIALSTINDQLSTIDEGEGILILQGGTLTTELGLVENLPLEELKHEDWALRGWEYGTQDLYHDVFCQLLYPQWLPEQKFLQNLKLEIPQPGEPDRPKRDRTTIKLENFSEGQSLLETAKRTLLILQKQEAFSTYLGHQEWGATRSVLIEKIIWPLYERLNQQINEALSEKGWYSEAIAKVYCGGELFTLLFPFIQSWLSHKLPKANLTLLPHHSNHSLIAEGLSRLPLFPQMLDRLRHQYSDYFLLAELLRGLKEEPLTSEQIVQSLEYQGIPRACLGRILPLLSGQLPEGFIPSLSLRVRMTAKSREFLPYPAIASAPLFNIEPPLYSPNTLQKKRLQQYLIFLLTKSKQKLQDPLAIE